ncbi:MAG: ABC transporter ATP-binding protein [Gemmatimonadaceae bacterium]
MSAQRERAVAFTRALFAQAGGRAWRVLALSVALSLTEWVGLLLLVPMLALVGLDVSEGAVGRIAGAVRSAFAGVGARPTVLAVLAVYVVVVALRTLLQRAHAVASTVLEQGFISALRRRLYHAVTSLPWPAFARERTSDFTHALTTELDRVGTASSTLFHLASQLLAGTIYLALAVQISPAMSAIAAGCGALLLLALRRWNARASNAGEILSEAGADLASAVQEHLGGLKTARSYGAEGRNEAAFGALSERLARTYAGASAGYATAAAWFSLGSVLVLSVLVYLSLEVLALPTAAILLLLFLFARLVPRFSDIQHTWQYFVNALPAFTRVSAMIERCEARGAAPHAASPAAAPPTLSLRRGVRFAGVGFRYRPDGDAYAVRDLDLDIPAGRTTAIVGPSGAGKSTVADLVLGLLTPETGTVSVDGAPLTPERVVAWRERIGYVPQDTFLLHDTVRANLLWARPGATEAQLRGALAQAAAEGFVTQLPQGLDTVIGDRGVLLSGGERQRLALARALLREPALLILDEATSALDSENERRILDAIERLHGCITTLLITHRLTAVRSADRIHVMEHGSLVESGAWDALLATDGRLAALCRAQGIGGDDVARDPMATRMGGERSVPATRG